MHELNDKLEGKKMNLSFKLIEKNGASYSPLWEFIVIDAMGWEDCVQG